MVLFMHVPVYFPGQNIDYSCGHPQWDEAHDCYYEIERRQPWPKEGHTATTQAFCELVRECPQIIGCFAGHTSAPLTSTTGDFSTWSVPITAAMP